MARSTPDHEVVRITSARQTRAEDQAARQRRYLLLMGFRVVCFVSAVAFFDGWVRYVLMAAAVFLPYIAVVFANNEERRADHFLPDAPGAGELGPGPEAREL